MLESVLSIFGTIIGFSSKTQEEQEYYYTQTLLLGEQHTKWSNYVDRVQLNNIISTFLVPTILFSILLFLYFKKR